jgi:hypothetical protein
MNKALELIEYAKYFNVRKEKSETYYVEMKETDLAATIEGEEITYYLTGCYNSGADWLDIDIEELCKLKKFCELMTQHN